MLEGGNVVPMSLRAVVIAFPLAELLLAASLCAQYPDSPRTNQRPDGFLFQAPRATLAVRAGYDLRRARSDIFGFFKDTLTLSRSDFNAVSIAGDLGIRISGPVDLVLGAAYARRAADSEFRGWVDQDGLPITQTTTFYTVPLSASLRWYLASRGRQVGRFVWIPARFQPYVGAGAGMVRYSLKQAGSFVDSEDLSIFSDVLLSEGWTPMGLVMAGVDYTVVPRVGVNADVRYLHGNGNLRGDFVGFTDGIDLSGFQFSLGLQFRL